MLADGTWQRIAAHWTRSWFRYNRGMAAVTSCSHKIQRTLGTTCTERMSKAEVSRAPGHLIASFLG